MGAPTCWGMSAPLQPPHLVLRFRPRQTRRTENQREEQPPPLTSTHAAPRSAAPPPWHLSHLVHSAAEVPVSPAGARQPELRSWPVESPSWTTPWEDEKALGSGGSIRGRSAVRERALLPGKAVETIQTTQRVVAHGKRCQDPKPITVTAGGCPVSPSFAWGNPGWALPFPRFSCRNFY